MKPSTYRDMHLLQAVNQSPDVTQRELAKRIGVALGLTNLMLRRLAKKGYIKIAGTKRSRIRYLITPQGILEKSRLTYEFLQYSLHLYSRVRHFLREQLTILAKTGHRRVLLYGTGELAEIAFLTVREIGLELVGVVDESPTRNSFLGYPVQKPSDVTTEAYDRVVVSSFRAGDGGIHRLVASGIPLDRMIVLPTAGSPGLLLEGTAGSQPVAPESLPVLAATSTENQVTAS